MIVKADKDYGELFRSAETQLQLPEGSIVSLHDYFSIIDENLGRISQSEELANLIRLPIEEDEPYFEINANTREIKVPPVFQQNGLTVKGDKLAEIVYFKMDRFFDLQDFFNFRNTGIQTGNEHDGSHAYVEWYNPNATSADTQKGVDLVFAMTADEEYIYFGWPLADYVSGDAGTIQFTVRFLTINQGEVTYNYSTKIATCEVKTTLNFPLDDGSITAFSWESLIYNRPIYSAVVNSTDSPAPALLYGIISHVADMEYGKIGEESVTTTTVVHHEASGDTEDGHNGEAWDENVENTTTEDVMGYFLDIPVVANISVASALEQTLTFKWIKDGAQITAVEERDFVTETKPAGAVIDGEGNYPETAVKSVYKAHDIGKYTVWIGNKIEGKNKIRYVYTGTVTIPGAEDVIISNDGIVAHGYVGETHLSAGIVNTVEKPDLKYTWYMDNNTVEGQIVQGPQSDSGFDPEDEGHYYCGVTNSRNGDTTEPSFSDVADIRMPPQRLTGLTFAYDAEAGCFTASVTHEYTNHKIEYEWHYVEVIDVHTGDTGAQENVLTEITGAYSEYAPTKAGLYSVTAGEIVFDDVPGMQRRLPLPQRTVSEMIYVKEQGGKLVVGQYPEENNG